MSASRRIALLSLAAAVLFAAAPASAPAAEKEDEAVPSTAVGRLKIAKGTVWVRPADSGEWEEYGHNFAVAERSRVSVPHGSEAEIQFRGSQFLLLTGGTEVDILQLGDKQVSFGLRSGQASLSLPAEDFAPVRIRAPGNREIQLDVPGRYVLTAEGGETKFLVRTGEGSVIREGTPPVVVKAGEEASIAGEIRVARAETPAPAPPPEAPLTEAERGAGVPPAAARELRDYGEWAWTPEYGYVWRPSVTEGWTPYYYGRWAWIYPYGWTWVPYEPWGWWPYHYGWWISYPAFGWVWWPFHSFVSVNFVFGNSVFFTHRAVFFPHRVVFVKDGRFIRWVPARPGTRGTATTFSRRDARLARWDRPMDPGTIRAGGRGRAAAAGEGRNGVSRGLDAVRGSAAARPGRTSGGSFRSPGVEIGATRGSIGRPATPGIVPPSAEGGGRVLAGPGPSAGGRRSSPGAPAPRISAFSVQGRGAGERPRVGSGANRGPVPGGAWKGPRDFGPRGGGRSMMGTGSPRLSGEAFRGSAAPFRGLGSGGSRRFDGGFMGSGSGLRGFGGGFRGGGGGRMR